MHSFSLTVVNLTSPGVQCWNAGAGCRIFSCLLFSQSSEPRWYSALQASQSTSQHLDLQQAEAVKGHTRSPLFNLLNAESREGRMNLEEMTNIRFDVLSVVLSDTGFLYFFLMLMRRGRGLRIRKRCGKILHWHHSELHCTHNEMHADESPSAILAQE